MNPDSGQEGVTLEGWGRQCLEEGGGASRLVGHVLRLVIWTVPLVKIHHPKMLASSCDGWGRRS